MDKQPQLVDKRPKAAVYSTTGNQRARRAVELLGLFCLCNNLNCVFYLDKKLPKEGQQSAWQRLLDDVSQGKYAGVIMWMQSDSMQQFCEGYNTKYLEVDPWAWLQAMRTSKADIVHLDTLR